MNIFYEFQQYNKITITLLFFVLTVIFIAPAKNSSKNI